MTKKERGKGMERLKMRLNTPQVLFMAFFSATIITISSYIVEWDKRIYAGIFAFITTFLGGILAKIFFKDKD
jgi:hypothetical protein